MLKAVENLGVSYVKGHEPYQSKMEAEIRKVKFSYRVSKRGNKCSFSSIYSCTESQLWKKSYIRYKAFIKINIA